MTKIKRRHFLDNETQPKEGWRTIPVNSYYEAHPTGLIRNRLSQKLIKGTQTRRNHDRYAPHEIVYLINPKKTSYSRSSIIAHTFPELISQSRGDLKNGYVCFKDGDRTNCNVNNLFIGAGKVHQNIFKMNNSYLTRKDIKEDIIKLTNNNLLHFIEDMFINNEEQYYVHNTIIRKKGHIISIENLEDKRLVEFTLDIDKIK